MISKRKLLGGTGIAAILAIGKASASITDSNGNPIVVSPGTPYTFTGLNVSGSAGPTITISSIPSSGNTSSTVSFNFTYTGAAPSGLTAVWQTGAITATVTGFTASGGSGSATVATPATAATYTLHITGTGANTATATAPNSTVISTVVSGAFPGQSGNPVGFAVAAGFPGSLTSASGTNITASASFKLFDTAHNPASISGTGFTFTGCYFGVSTNANTGSQGWITYASGGGHTFTNCTFGPSPSVVGGSFPPLPPGGGGYTNWPSQRGTTDSVGLPYAQGNQYGVIGSGAGVPPGGLTFNSCDIWGFSNGAVLFSQTNASNPVTVNNCWMHDPCLAPPGAHTDVIGDVQSDEQHNPPILDYVQFLTMTNNTIAGVSSEGIALQFDEDMTVHDITITGNYISTAASWMLYLGLDVLTRPATNYKFMNNTIDSTFIPQFGICGDGVFGTIEKPFFSVSGSGNQWRGNKVMPGTYGSDPGTAPQLIVTASNQFLWPDMTANNGDFTGAF